MHIKLQKPFKSLLPFEIELPDFVVLTGLNGAGKTQILTAINQKMAEIIDMNGIALSPIQYITGDKLAPNESVVITRTQLSKKSEELWKVFQQLNYASAFFKPTAQDVWLRMRQNIHGADDNINSRSQATTISRILGAADKPVDQISSSDFFDYYPIDDSANSGQVFYQNFSSLFKRYQDKYENNGYNEFRNVKHGDKHVFFLSEKEFISKYGEAPWDFVNKIIQEANLDYHVNSPVGSNRDAPFELKLINKISNAEVKFNDLSSGEKVLMSLSLALYNSSIGMEFPKVLLMDEPDGSLHPSMAKQFLRVIENIFVKEKGVKVIITTHSPSTIALAPDSSIFIVNKTAPRMEKVSKDKALKILTAGVPSFSVNYENRRQIFLESGNDVLFYEKLYQSFSAFLNPEVSLSFISSGDSRTDKNGTKVSNCSQVISITHLLREKGNKLIWGIIDWDTTNSESESVKVLGNGRRYNIESYLLDPLLVAAFLLREKMVLNTDMGLTESESYNNLRSWGQPRIQLISDWVVNKVGVHLGKTETEITKASLINGSQIEIPTWYLHYPGHDLENALISVFPELGKIKRGKEELLKLDILTKVVDDFPEIVSVDILDTFRNVQSE